MPPVIEVTNLTRRYGSLTAVDHISFQVEMGSLFAFLGPNGAGKSTTISTLTTLARPDEGAVTFTVDGCRFDLCRDTAAIRHRIGVIFQDSLLDKPLTVRDNLSFRARLYGQRSENLDRVIDLLGLGEILRQTYGTLSGGQRRRVDIARALLTDPAILFLDEPTTGLDPHSRNLVWETIDRLRRENDLTVFLTTHDMEEAESADHVVIIDHGRIIAHGTPPELRTAYSRPRLRLRGHPVLWDTLTGQGLAPRVEQDWITVAVGDSRAKTILATCLEAVDSFEFTHGTMDDVFLALTGASLREH